MAPVFARTLEGIDGGASGGISPDPSPGTYQVSDYLDIDDAAVSITSDAMVTGSAILGNLWLFSSTSSTAHGTQVNRLCRLTKTVPVFTVTVSGFRIRRAVPGSIILAISGSYKVNQSDSYGLINTLPYSGTDQSCDYVQSGSSFFVKNNTTTTLDLAPGITINPNHPNGRYFTPTDFCPLLLYPPWPSSQTGSNISAIQDVSSITDLALNVSQIILTDEAGSIIATEDVNL